MKSYDVIIVGTGHGGTQAAIQLRKAGYDGSIAMIGEEPDLPYDRTALSKEFMAGDKPFSHILIQSPSFWQEKHIDLMPGKRVNKINPETSTVTIGSKEQIGYGKLIWAAGATPRPLSCSGAHHRGIYNIRKRNDVEAILAHLPSIHHIAMIGGGYIGLEVAAVLVGLGKKVTLIESQPRLLSRVAGEYLADFLESEHRSQGVDIRTDTIIDSIEAQNGAACAITISDQTQIAVDAIITGIGVIPEVAALIAAGAIGGNGVDVDDYCRTSLPDIYAIGDCACHPNPFARGAQIRIESTQNAQDQAKTVTRHIMDDPTPYNEIPRFWSRQYDLDLQTLGLSMDHDTTLLRGSPDSRSFSVLYLLGGKIIAMDCVNAPQDYAAGEAHILSGAILDQEQLTDPSRPLNEVELA